MRLDVASYSQYVLVIMSRSELHFIILSTSSSFGGGLHRAGGADFAFGMTSRN